MVHDSIIAEWCNAADKAIDAERHAGFNRAGQVQPGDPSPGEIASMTAAIRSEWSEHERQKRAPWAAAEWTVPACRGNRNVVD